MGSSVSAGVDNNDLVDNLLAAEYIKTPGVERVFRAVDRGMYFTDLGRESAYKDLAWKSGNIHLSAPCIYCEVMENLSLAPGMSFLNLGSGTGYLNTMAGLILGSFGTNHGVEIHPDLIVYALKKLEEFKKTAAAIDEFDFCEPKFVQGNCLLLDSSAMKYDRVYCGAACPGAYENYMKNLIKVGGILVVPLNDQLLRITRVSETSWETRSVLPVAFANLLLPSSSPSVILPIAEPIPLMEACRAAIRGILKTVIDQENPELKAKTPPVNKTKKQRTLRRLLIPMFGDSESMTIITGLERMERVPEGDSDENSTHTPTGESGNISDGRSDHTSANDASSSPTSRGDHASSSLSVLQLQHSRSSSDDSDDPSDSSVSSSSLASMYHVPNALFRAMASYDIGNLIPPLEATRSVSSSVFPTMTGASETMTGASESSSDSSVLQDDSSDSSMDVDQPGQEISSQKSKTKYTQGAAPKRVRNKRKEAEMDECDQSSNAFRRSSNTSCTSASGDNSQPRKGQQTYSSKKKREKVDSGIGEEINNWEISPSDVGSELELASDSESEEDSPPKHKSDEKLTVIHGRPYRNASTPVRKSRKGSASLHQCRQPEPSAYGLWMRSKIQQLPLPPSIKLYINHHRDL